MSPSQLRPRRTCSRASCRSGAMNTLTYIYADSTAVLGPLATFAEPHAYDLCALHSEALRVPMGWTVIKQEIDGEESGQRGPSDDDLMAIADAVREVGNSRMQSIHPQVSAINQEIGRRGHLRALPSE